MSLPRLGEEDDALPPEAIEFVRRALSTPLPATKDLLSITLPAPKEAAEKFLRLVPRESGFLWRSQGRDQFAGGGVAAKLTISGVDRFAVLSREVPKFFARIVSVALEGPPPLPILVGGAAFAPDVPPFEPWQEFTEDAFVLPRFGFRRQRGTASLTLSISREELQDSHAIDNIIDELRTLTNAFEYETATSLIERIDLARVRVRHLAADDWTAYIDAIHRAIASGEYQKIVAARRCVVELDRKLEDTGFMARVFAAYPDCTHFAIRRDHSTFLGATPETLFRKRGLRLETHALAGTTRISEDPGTESSRDVAALQSSQKDLAEHALVVQRIASELEPLSTNLEYASTPSTRQVRNLIHLQTPISGHLREGTTVFDLLAALHPTPAIGGFPAREAVDWLVQNEPLERGWYAGVVGWIDAAGDGEFAVAIRCGVLTPTRAYIYAGAGIVAASNAAAEYAETAGKMGPVLRALGVVF
jgi:menaquinone-specific isochorismate synthase